MKKELSQQIWEKTSGWIDGIGDVVNQLAKQLGVAAGHVYEVYTRQMFVEGLIYSIIALIIIIADIIIVPKVYKWTKPWDEKWRDGSDGRIAVCALATIAGIGLFFGMVFGVLIPYAMQAANPEYYTMKEIFDMVKSAAK